jgi:hypothetical protein
VTTVTWQPDLVTGPDGTVTAKFALPDNLTTFRVMAVADHGATGFGSATSGSHCPGWRVRWAVSRSVAARAGARSARVVKPCGGGRPHASRYRTAPVDSIQPTVRLVRPQQIAAANAIYSQLPGWQRLDEALGLLAIRVPGFDAAATLVKLAAVNQLYSTRILAVVRVAQHFADVLGRVDLARADAELVEALAAVAGRRHHSAASKFAHFFVDPNRFSILDALVEEAVQAHTDVRPSGGAGRYMRFAIAVDRLFEASGLKCSRRELDRYLWLAGAWRMWRAGKRVGLSSEALALFERRPPEVAVLVGTSC